MKITTRQLINGELVEGAGEALSVIDPATGNEVTTVKEASNEQVDAAIRGAQEAFEKYSRTTPAERSALLHQIADVLEENSRELAELESLDVGKPWPSADDGEMPWAAMKGSGTGCDMSVYSLDAYTAIRHIMIAH